MEEKTCRLCGEAKPAAAFSKQSRGRSGLQPYCKPCATIRSSEARRVREAALRSQPETLALLREREAAKKARDRAANPAGYAKRTIAYRQENVARYLCAKARARAAEIGVPFEITPADLVIPEDCPVLGVKMQVGGDRNTSPTIDRLVPALGYVPGNVRVISHRANRIKTDATLNELRALVAYLSP